MQSGTMREALEKQPLTRDFFKDVVAADMLPEKEEQCGIYVVNTHPHQKPGEHWVTIEYASDHVKYFDPTGNPPHETITHYLKKTKARPTIVYSAVRRQGIRATCGLYCMYQILTRTSAQHSLDVFSTDYEFNDRLVYKLVHTYFDL